jgi:FkbM family methyltransferase
MKRNLKRWMTFRTFIYIKYIPIILFKIKNWEIFLLNYLGIRHKGGKYVFRNGITIEDEEGTATGTIAVVFFRKHYGNVDGKSVIIDIGANIGVFSIYAALEGKNVKVYTFEPISKNYQLLLKNISNNNLSDRIKPFNLGIASKNEKRKFHLESSPLHSLVQKGENNFSASVDCISLNYVLVKNKISKVDLLKMNCEGGEYEILYSTPIDCFKKIFEIRMEYHNIDSEKNNLNHLISFLENMGYKTINIWKNSKKDGFLWVKRAKEVDSPHAKLFNYAIY